MHFNAIKYIQNWCDGHIKLELLQVHFSFIVGWERPLLIGWVLYRLHSAPHTAPHSTKCFADAGWFRLAPLFWSSDALLSMNESINLNIVQWYMRALLNRLTALLLALRIGDLLVYGLFK
jgi:hypothetical protein